MRKCAICKKPMTHGYCVNGGMEYFCTPECLHKVYTPEEWTELYADGETDSYWTVWDDGGDGLVSSVMDSIDVSGESTSFKCLECKGTGLKGKKDGN